MKMFERARPEALPACMLDSASGPESMHGRMPAFLEAAASTNKDLELLLLLLLLSVPCPPST